MSKKKLIIDVDNAIRIYNEKNPSKKPLNRERLAKDLKLSYQSLVNYQGGKIPSMIGVLRKIMNKTGVSFSDLIKFK